MIDRIALARDFRAIKENAPLVHNITNYVAMNFTANALLAAGASPVMAHAVEEVAEMTSIASALVINIGTLDSQWIQGMMVAGNAMRKRGGFIVLDPVGAGATSFRTDVAWQLIDSCKPDVVRGNGSEIMALMNADIRSKGVDSSTLSHDALDSAKALARQINAVVTISGATDYVTDGERVETISNGSPMMTLVTAMGCTASSMIGAFAAVDDDAFSASLHAMALMGVAGEMAAKKSAGPGSLLSNFVDELYNISPEILANNVRQ